MSQHDNHPSRSKRRKSSNPTGSSCIPNDGGVQLHLPIDSAFHLKAGFKEFLVEAGLLMMHAFINEEVEGLAGKRYQHDDG